MPLNTEELYRNLFETSKDCILIVEQESGKIVDVNSSACKLYGYNKDEFLNLTIVNITAKPDKTKASATNLEISISEKYHYKKDGTKFPVETTVSYFKQNNTSYINCFIKDLTELLQSKQEAEAVSEMFQTIIDVSPLSITYLDVQNNIKIWNKSAERIFGWKAEEVLGKPIPIIPKERENEFETLSKEVFNNESVVGREVVRQRKDGSLITVNLSSSVIYDRSGQVIGRMAIIEDVTERKQMEEKFNENEVIFSSFMEHSPIYVFFKDKDIRAIRLSRNFEQMLGIPVSEALGKTMDDLFPSDLAKSMVADDKRILNEARRVEVIEELNGKIYKTIKFPILKDGKPVMLAGFTQDITEQKLMTEELEMLKLSVDKHFDGAYWMDTDNRFVYVNDAGCSALKYTREELLTMNLFDVNTNATPEVLQRVWNKLRNEGSYISETSHRRKDGTEFPVEISSTLVKFGNKEYNCGFARDITDRRKMMQILKSSEEKFAIAFMASPEAMAISALKGGTYIDVNDNFLKKTGFSREEIIGHTSEELNFWVNPNDRVSFFNQLKEEGQLRNFEVSFRLRSGEIRDFTVSSQIIEIDNKQCSLNFIDDITERKKAEKELVESEAVLRSLIQNRNESIWSIDKELKYVIINDMFRRSYLGAFGVEIKPGMNATDALPPDLKAFWKTKYQAALAGEIIEFEYSQVILQKPYTFSVNITPIIINMDVIGASVISIDITQRKKGEAALQQSEEKFRRIAEQLVDVIFTTDTNGAITYLSPSCEQVFGWKSEEMTGRMFTDFLDENSSALAMQSFRIHLEKAEPTRNLLLSMKSKNGGTFPGEVNSSVIENDQGVIIGLLGLIRNISEKVAFEEALTNERNQLRTLIDNLPDFIFFKDAKGRYIVNNKTHIRSIGRENQEDVIGKDAFDLHLKEFAERISNDEKEIVQTGQPIINKEENVFRQDLNEPRWHLTSKIPIKDSKGRVISIVGISRDITERKQIEEALKLSEERLRLALEGANDGIWDVDMENGAVYVSPRGCEILGYKPYELPEIAKVWSDLVCAEDLPLTNEKLTAYLNGETAYFEVEQRLKTKSGQLKWILTRGKATEMSANGSPKRMIGTHTDISNRKQIEEALKTSEEKYRQLFENMTVGFALHEMIFDDNSNPLDYRFIEINPAFEKLTGLDAPEIVGKTVREVIPGIEQYWIDFYGEVVKSGNPTSYQNYSSGLGKYYDVWVFSTKDNRFATIINDITEQKLSQEAIKHQNEEYQSLNQEYLLLNEELLDSNEKLERINKDLEMAKARAEESDRLKTAFLCNMSHEIRTPMNAILGFSDFIIKPTISEDKKARFSRLIKDRANDLLRIIEDILDISKIEIGQMNIVESEVNISDLLNDLLEYYKQRKESLKPDSNIKISLEVNNSLIGLLILVDGQRLKQVLTNMVDNALKFTSEGSIIIGCEFSGPEKLLFSVCDTGIGIPADKQHVVFDRFRQAEDLYSTRHYGGTGLGLSISKGLVNLMGGDIWFDSTVGVGTRFFFTLPYKSKGEKHSEMHENDNHSNLMKKKVSILVVEDDESSAELLNEIIEGLNVNIINVYNGKDALEAFQSTKELDIVLLDIRLPDANGLDIARQMKVLRPEVPIIAQTAYASDSDSKDCIQAGCSSYISKPIMANKLLEIISGVLGNGKV